MIRRHFTRGERTIVAGRCIPTYLAHIWDTKAKAKAAGTPVPFDGTPVLAGEAPNWSEQYADGSGVVGNAHLVIVSHPKATEGGAL